MPRVSFTPRLSVPRKSFPSRVNIARAVVSKEPGAGGRTVTPPQQSPIIASNVPCSIQDREVKEQTSDGRTITVTKNYVYTPEAVPVMNGDFILFGDRVFIVKEPSDQMKKIFRIGCIEYQTQPIT